MGYKQDDHINREHNLNLKSQYKKISEMGYSYNDRKKKPYDPVANPALVFKRKKPRGVSSEVAGPGPAKYHLQDSQSLHDQYYQAQMQQQANMNMNYGQAQGQRMVKSTATKPKKVTSTVQQQNVNPPKNTRQRIYRTEFGDLTEDE